MGGNAESLEEREEAALAGQGILSLHFSFLDLSPLWAFCCFQASNCGISFSLVGKIISLVLAVALCFLKIQPD